MCTGAGGAESCLFRAARFRAGPAHPVRRSLSEIPYLRPLEALLEEIGTIDELLDAAIRRAGHAAVDVDARANRRTGRAWAEERSGESLERVEQTLPRPRVRRRGSRDARTAEGPPAIGAAKLELVFLQPCGSVGKAIGILRADVGDDAFVRFPCV